jgi:TolB-like protein
VRAGLLAAVFVPLAALATAAGAEETVRVVILPVVVHRAANDSGYVSRGVADMLSARLEQVGGISVVRVENAKAATTDREAATETASRLEGDFVLYGAFTQFGEGASLDIRCASLQAASAGGGTPRRVFIQSGTVGEIIPKLDMLVDKIVVFLRGGGAAVATNAPVPGGAVNPQDADDGAADAETIRELRERVEALERAVYEAAIPEDASAATGAVEEGLPES